MIAIRSARRIASSKSWVMKTMVLCSAACSRRNSFCISRRISGSSAENGSSRNQTSGPTASERAMPTRCCCPPESSRGRFVLAALEADELDHLARARLALRAGDALHLQRKGDVAQHREVRQQREVLEHHAHAVPADLDQLAVGDLAEIPALEAHLAGGRLDQPREAADQRRLARAGQPHDHEDLARADREARVDHRRHEAGGGELVRLRRRRTPGEEGLRAGAEELPEVAAGDLGLGRSHRPTPAVSSLADPGLPARLVGVHPLVDHLLERACRRDRRRRSSRPSPRCRS